MEKKFVRENGVKTLILIEKNTFVEKKWLSAFILQGLIIFQPDKKIY